MNPWILLTALSLCLTSPAVPSSTPSVSIRAGVTLAVHDFGYFSMTPAVDPERDAEIAVALKHSVVELLAREPAIALVGSPDEAQYLLFSMVAVMGNKVRVQVNIIRVADQIIVAAPVLERANVDTQDIAQMIAQAAIAALIATRLRPAA